jgi:archaeal preflagellin peptidase FlaK
MQALFIAANITLSLSFLLYASWSDYKTREVSNRVWVIYAPIALSLSLADFLLFDPARLPFFALSFGVTAAIAILLFYTGAFGGADSKALMCIALALPFSTETLFNPLITGGVSPISQILFPLTVFSNGVLFAAATGVYMVFYNILWHRRTRKKAFDGTLATESVGKKLVAMITGHKVSVVKLKEKWHIYPMEDVEDESGANQPKRKLVVVPKDEGRDEIVARLSKAASSGKIDSYVWATPGLPMLIFITAGLVVALVFGDVVWLLVSFMLH